MKSVNDVMIAVVDEVALHLKQPLNSFDLGSNLEQSLGADSLDIIEMAMNLEDKFGWAITDAKLNEITTIENFVDFFYEAQPGV